MLKDNDLVLLASDGIFDNVININEFEKFILSIRYLEPQKISYELLNYARHTDLVSKDDMSVIVLKIKHV
jgi:serine/threonine protein phosphatase PrpC